MFSLDKYGKIVREYRAEGLLNFNDKRGFDCSVHAVQLADGKIIASCLFEKDLHTLRQYLNQDIPIISITGVTESNEQFLLKEDTVILSFSDSGKSIRIVVRSKSMGVRRQINRAPKLVKFGITNFRFIGNRCIKNANRTHLGILILNLPDSVVEIYQLPDYDEIIESLRVQRGIDLTCEANVTISSLADTRKAAKLVNDVCTLLSIARGTKINWIYYDCYGEYGERIASFHRNNNIWEYTHAPLIDWQNPNETPSFVGQVYEPFLQKKNIHGLDIAIDAYLEAKRTSIFLETRALEAIIVIEFLKSKYAVKKGTDLLVNIGQFKNIQRSVENLLAEQFKQMSLSPENDVLENMKLKIPELNRRPFKSILRNMFADIELTISDDELERFVKIRNSLVHKASFTKQTKQGEWEEYTLIMSILDRIFLRILSYSGDILDVREGFKRIKI